MISLADSTDNRKTAPEDALFEQKTLEFLAEEYAQHPVMATAMGVHDYDDSFDNFHRFALRAERDRVRTYLHTIDKLSLADLNAENRLDYRLARSHAQMTLSRLEQERWPERQPAVYLSTLFEGVLLLLCRPFATAEVRAISLLGRLRAFPRVLLEAQDNLKASPRLFLEVALEIAESGDTFLADALPFFFSTLSSAGLQHTLTEANVQARTALAKFVRFLCEEQMPSATGEATLGKALYGYRLRVNHFLDKVQMNSEVVFGIGEASLEAAKRELRRLAEQIAPGKGWENLIQELKQVQPEAGEWAANYQRERERAKAFVETHRLVSLPKGEMLTFAEMPEFVRPLRTATAYLSPAPFDAKSEGILWVVPLASTQEVLSGKFSLPSPSLYEIPRLVARHLSPGSHLQQVLASRTPSRVRRHFAQSVLFQEGWAFYCEAMMGEQGFYTDPKVHLMQQYATLLQSCRHLLDVQLHTRQLTLGAGVKFLQEEAKLEEAEAWAEVRRIVLTPTQSVTPILGRQAIQTIQEEAHRRLDSHISLQKFHDRLLSFGSLPPHLIREALFAL